MHQERRSSLNRWVFRRFLKRERDSAAHSTNKGSKLLHCYISVLLIYFGDVEHLVGWMVCENEWLFNGIANNILMLQLIERGLLLFICVCPKGLNKVGAVVASCSWTESHQALLIDWRTLSLQQWIKCGPTGRTQGLIVHSHSSNPINKRCPSAWGLKAFHMRVFNSAGGLEGLPLLLHTECIILNNRHNSASILFRSVVFFCSVGKHNWWNHNYKQFA